MTDDCGAQTRLGAVTEVLALLALFFIYAGDHAPAINEAHYLVKAKNFWDPTWCGEDLFAASRKAHVVYYATFGWLTTMTSLGATAWVGRVVGWLMLAAGLRFCCRHVGLAPFFSLVVALIWIAGVEYGNLAGEWVIGGIEAKVPAYGLVLFGFGEIARRRWERAWVWFGIASAFHVLTGGWAVIAGWLAFLVTERVAKEASAEPRVAFFSRGLFLGGFLALFGLVPAVWLTTGATPEESSEAARIYSYVRIRHHLLPGDFPAWWFLRHGIVVSAFAAFAFAARLSDASRRMVWVGAGALAIGGCGLLVGMLPAVAPELAAKLLRYYWFRLSDAVVPLVLGILVAQALVASPFWFKNAARLVLLFAVALTSWSTYCNQRLGLPASTNHRFLGIRPAADVEAQRRSHQDWIAVCDWIRVATPEDEVFFTPRHQQTFKWYAERAEVVNWKDVPQDAKSLIEWEKRFDDVYPSRLGRVRVTIQYTELARYRKRYGVRFMVVDNRIAGNHLPLAKVYPTGEQENATYSVYEFPYEF
ncbi:MAG: DUF6798 domain-containing protein [Planctomycetota bacterium]